MCNQTSVAGIARRNQLALISIKPDIVKEQLADSVATFNPNSHGGDTLQVHIERCQVNVPWLPHRLHKVVGITIVRNLETIDLNIQLSGHIGRKAEEPQRQRLNTVGGPVTRFSQRQLSL